MTTAGLAGASARDALLSAARAELAEHGNAGVSLRAIARRAGVSHAAPKYFFDDRAGLLTAVATAGFRELTRRLQDARDDVADPVDLPAIEASPDEEPRPRPLVAAGRIYFDFGLDEPALFDLMFRSADLHPDDPGLLLAKAEALGQLTAVVGGSDATAADDLTLGNWAFAHGLVVLAREQALGAAGRDGAREVAHRLIAVFTSRTGGE